MNILFNIRPSDGWARAANYLGHNGFVLHEDKIFDSFAIAKPDIFITLDSFTPEINKALDKFPIKTIILDNYLPASDCPLDFLGGSIKDYFKTDAVIIGSYDKKYDKYISTLYNSDLDFKIFGSGDWDVPQYVGFISPLEICDAYASAKWSLDLEAESTRVLAISSSGGNPLSAGKWNIGVAQLDQCINFSDEFDLISKIKSEPIKLNLRTPILADRLKEILEK